MVSLLEALWDESEWERFYAYKTSLACPKAYAKTLRRLIDAHSYLPALEALSKGEAFPLPRRKLITKAYSDKKRVVYTYPEPYGSMLKLLTFLILRKYDFLFSGNLFSFRPRRSAKDAIRYLRTQREMPVLYAYKADISDYFNSLPVEALLLQLERTLQDDMPLYDFLSQLLREPCALVNGQTVAETKGIMAGTPQSSFFANLYLRELDASFAARAIPYARYADDIIVFGFSAAETEMHAQTIRSFLSAHGLNLNPSKEEHFTPETGWDFLGFHYQRGTTDIAPASVEKMKGKMRRKARALMRWKTRNSLDGKRAARAFIRAFNRKMFESLGDNELSWTKWYFPAISTTRSLHMIDAFAQEQIRWLYTGTRTKARFDLRYEEMKRLGYKSLVHEYFKGGE